MNTTPIHPDLSRLLRRALVGLKYGADLAYRTETTDSCHREASSVGPKIDAIEAEIRKALQANAFDCGRSAALRGCFRVLASPESPDEEREWLAGYDTVPRENRGKWPRVGPVPADLVHLANT